MYSVQHNIPDRDKVAYLSGKVLIVFLLESALTDYWLQSMGLTVIFTSLSRSDPINP